MARAGQIFRFFAGEVVRQRGERVASVRPGIDVEVTREPVGVVAIVTPWNFPVAIPAWKIAPALAYGNCVVFKPADLVPGSAWALAEIISRAGFPAGVFNLVMGPGSRSEQAFVTTRRTRSATGSGTGRRVPRARRADGRQLRCGENRWVPTTRTSRRRSGARPEALLLHGQLHRVEPDHSEGHPAALRRRDGRAQALVVTTRKPAERAGVDRPVDVDLSTSRSGVPRRAALRGSASWTTDRHYHRPALFADAAPTMRIAREEISAWLRDRRRRLSTRSR